MFSKFDETGYDTSSAGLSTRLCTESMTFAASCSVPKSNGRSRKFLHNILILLKNVIVNDTNMFVRNEKLPIIRVVQKR